MDKRVLYALIVAAMIITTTTIRLNLPTSTVRQAEATPTRNLTATPPQTAWNKTYGRSGNDVARCVQQTSDGGYVIVGTTQSFGAGQSDFWLVKTDSAGNQQWNKTFGGTSWDEAYSVQQTSDGGYIVAGGTSSFGAGDWDFWLVKTYGNGDQQWNKTFGGTSWDEAYSVQQTSDGGYIVAGTTLSFGAGQSDFWLVKTDGSGNRQWNKTYGGTNSYDMAYSVQHTSDGGYIVTGFTVNVVGADVYPSHFWLVKTDSVGKHQWNKTYAGIANDQPYYVRQTSDSGYIIAGYTVKFATGLNDFWLVKTDSAGNHQWNKTYGGTDLDFAYSVQQTSDGGYIAAGLTASFGAGGPDFWLVRTDGSGNHQWNKTFGGTSWDVAYSVQQTSDGGYIVAGGTSSFGAGLSDFWLVKVDADSGGQDSSLIIMVGIVAAVAVVGVIIAVVLLKKRKLVS